MNYGRFFRLNQALSKVGEGIAIYDYVDLPAYFGPSENNPMSPKYPISVTITSGTVCFRLHYCAYKIEKKSLSDVNKIQMSYEERKRVLNYFFPQYAYDKEDLDNKSLLKINNTGVTDMNMAHMEEVVLELPWNDNVSNQLSDILKNIYNTTFPQVIDENTSMGGRFLEQLIKKRYPGRVRSDEEVKGLSLEDQLHHKLQIVSDNTASYSSLWLMGLLQGKEDNKYYDLFDKKGNVIGFLRKLLLDFMFDLKHSDVFQNSAYYQMMCIGLMSNFYFSALMHKCEYYYCRKLILKEIKDLEESKNKRGINDIEEIDNKRIAKEKSIKVLYASNLFKAEQTWVNDIISPQAEKYFDFLYPQKTNIDKGKCGKKNGKETLYSEIKSFLKVDNPFRPDQFLPWDSWFAPPEEEMKRVCFSMKEDSSQKEETPPRIHACNTDTVAKYLMISQNKDNLEKEMGVIRSEIRESISRWFLKRYDFHDTAHLHLSKYSNWSLVGGLLVLIIILYNLPIIVVPDYFELKPLRTLQHYFPLIILLLCIMVGYCVFYYMWSKEKTCFNSTDDPLIKKSYDLSKRRITVLFAGLILLLIVLGSSLLTIIIASALIGIACLFPLGILDRVRFYFNKLISCLHLFFPRLVASITTAWLTITLGFDLYSSFFDKPVSLPTAIFVSVVILMFIMFEINQITPRVNMWRKLLRSLELLLISWCISILVGIVVIDFVGERYLERGGYVENYLSEYVVKDTGVEPLNMPTDTDGRIRAKMVDELANYKPIVLKFYLGEHEVFYMRDFLFMFSFITMFMGIFLQMFIFDEKKMTEF